MSTRFGPGSFGEGATRLCGVASRLLGWRPAEFWAATPAELATSLAPPPGAARLTPLSRDEFNHLMEADNVQHR